MKKEEFDWDVEAERDLWRAICAPNCWHAKDGVTPATHPRSLHYFLFYCWGIEFYFTDHPEQPRWYYEKIHGPYLTWLQKHILAWKVKARQSIAEQYYIAVVLPREFGKTVTATKAAMIWTHLDEPDMSTLIASATTPLAQDILSAIEDCIAPKRNRDDSWFCWLYGNWRAGSKSFTKGSIEHGYRKAEGMSEPSFDTCSVDSGMTGYHHRIHVWDDPIIKNKLREGGVYMNAVHDAVNASYNALQKNGLLMFVLTRYLDDDVAGRHFREEGVASWEGIPCPNTMMFDKVPMGQGSWHVFFYQTEDVNTGEPTHPILWTKNKIAEAKRRDPEDFACQQQNDPGTSELAPILESQLESLFMTYEDFYFQVQTLNVLEYASVHIDTAFKKKETIGQGDDSAIGVWLHDARRNGRVYLDTKNLLASNEWREEDFNDNLVRVLLNLRRRGINIKCITDEEEPGGKAGTYKNRIIGIIRASGLRLRDDQFIQFNRRSNKRARIRTGIGHWTEDHVRVLLDKDANGKWIIPPVVRKLFNQILRIDIIKHEDIIDALTDGFTDGIWRKPSFNQHEYETLPPLQPGDEYLRKLSQPMSTEELLAWVREQQEINNTLGPGHGPDEYDIPREESPWPF